jgi:hypothetical protein
MGTSLDLGYHPPESHFAVSGQWVYLNVSQLQILKEKRFSFEYGHILKLPIKGAVQESLKEVLGLAQGLTLLGA